MFLTILQREVEDFPLSFELGTLGSERVNYHCFTFLATGCFTAPLNNTQPLKFKTQLRIAFVTAVNHNYHDNDKKVRNLTITVHGRDLLNPLKRTSVSRDVR